MLPKRRSTCILVILAFLIFLLSVLQFSFVTVNSLDQLSVSTLLATSITVTSPKKKNNNNIPVRNDNNSTFSACLLVMDDNHYLIEWLAFHYQTLPLRYLIIAVDPRSTTSPDVILNRWRQDNRSNNNNNNNNMTIVRWNDNDFLPKEWLNRKNNVSEHDSTAKFVLHRERQRNFYPACFSHLKQAGRTWTMVIDVDEFAIQNLHYHSKKRKRTAGGTLLNYIQKSPKYRQEECITMPRVRFGNYYNETVTTTDNNNNNNICSPAGFQDKDFMTLHWRYRAPLHSRKHNRNPKSMIDVSKIGIANFSRLNTDAHRPVRSSCKQRDLYIQNKDSPFAVHHYIGTWEQYNFRQDARDGMKQRNPQRFAEYNKIRYETDTSLCGWVQNFCNEYGSLTCHRLLEGVGNVSYTTLTFGR